MSKKDYKKRDLTNKAKYYLSEGEFLDMNLAGTVPADLETMKKQLLDNNEALKNLNTNSPDAIKQMRNLLIKNNETEILMREFIAYLERDSRNYAEYQIIKDQLIPKLEKDGLKELLIKYSNNLNKHDYFKAFQDIKYYRIMSNKYGKKIKYESNPEKIKLYKRKKNDCDGRIAEIKDDRPYIW